MVKSYFAAKFDEDQIFTLSDYLVKGELQRLVNYDHNCSSTIGPSCQVLKPVFEIYVHFCTFQAQFPPYLSLLKAKDYCSSSRVPSNFAP